MELKATLLQDERHAVVRSSAQMVGAPEPLSLAWSIVSENSWTDPVKAAFKPVEVTSKLWVVPQPDTSGLGRFDTSMCYCHLYGAGREPLRF
jgi:ribosomal protein L11 methylase PrmA